MDIPKESTGSTWQTIENCGASPVTTAEAPDESKVEGFLMTRVRTPLSDAISIDEVQVAESVSAFMGSCAQPSCTCAQEAFLHVCRRLDRIDRRLEECSSKPFSEGRNGASRITAASVRSRVRQTLRSAPADRARVVSVDELRARKASPLGISHKVSHSKDLVEPTRMSALRAHLICFVQNPMFDFAVCVMILANSVLIGVETEQSVKNPTHDGHMFEVVSIIFGCVFILEFALHIVAEGPWRYLCDISGWKCFDVVIVLESMSSVVVFCFATGEGPSNQENVRLIRSLKIMKVVRVLRVLRVLQFTVALRQLVQGITVALRSLGWATVLLAVLIYIFAVLFTSSLQLHDEEVSAKLRPFFGSIGDSSMLLVQAIFNGISWRQVVLLLREAGAIYEAIFLVYIAITMLTVLNVVTGVFTAIALKTSETDPEIIALNAEVNKKRLHELAIRLFKLLDVDGSGMVTLEELEDAWQKNEFKALLKALGIDAHDVWLLFSLMDDDSDGLIGFSELCEGIQKLVGNGLCLELARLQQGQRRLLKSVDDLLQISGVDQPEARVDRRTL